MKSRLRTYHDQTSPLIDFYSRRGLIIEVDGDKPIEDAFEDIMTALGRKSDEV